MKSLKIILVLAFLASTTFLKAQSFPIQLSTPSGCMNTQDCGFQMCITNYDHYQVSSNNSCFLVEVTSDGSEDIFIESTNGYNWVFEAHNYVSAVVCFGPDFGDAPLSHTEIFCGLQHETGRTMCRDGCVVDVGDGG